MCALRKKMHKFDTDHIRRLMHALFPKTTFPWTREHEKEPLNPAAVLDLATTFDSHGQSREPNPAVGVVLEKQQRL